MKTIEHSDVIIIGAGAAGLLLAARLAESGKQVSILEAGPKRSLQDLTSSQIWARRLKWSGPEVLETGNHPIGHAFNAGSGTGGSALHHYGVWLRMHENDFSVKTDYNKSLDWPLSYDDLRPHYDIVQEEVGLSGDAKAEKWRPPGSPYPMPPIPVFQQGQIIKKGFDKRKMDLSPIPLAINTLVHNGRPSCMYDGWCDAGCPSGALGNPLAVWLPRTIKSGVSILHDSRAIRILRDPNNSDRATAVEYLKNGKKHLLHSNLIIVAAFSVQSSRILLSSFTDKDPAPGNRQDQLGRYLTTHPAGSVYGLFEEETYPYQGVNAGVLLNQDFYKEKDYQGAFGSSQWLIANALKPNDLLGYGTGRPDIYGRELKPWLERAAKHLGSMTLVAEDISLAKNQVTLSDRTDSDGVPLAHTHHDVTEESRQLWSQRMSEGQEILRDAGAYDTWQGPMAAVHIMGGTVMGTSDKNSVTDKTGRVHDMENLYVCGPSLFPSSGAVNPTFTLSALASLQADNLISHQ